ncbi:hypothetical protein D5266_08380, partial [bacterium c-19]|nr:hypothetical protein [bacterium c-19]
MKMNVWYHYKALIMSAKRSLKTKQETSISNIKRYFGKQKKKKRKALELNQMESLILAQDER